MVMLYAFTHTHLTHTNTHTHILQTHTRIHTGGNTREDDLPDLPDAGDVADEFNITCSGNEDKLLSLFLQVCGCVCMCMRVQWVGVDGCGGCCWETKGCLLSNRANPLD